MKKTKFRPGIKITIFFVFFAVLFFSLGLWQIDRGQAKTVLLDEFEKNSLKSPGYISKDSKKWDRVYVEGSWDGSNQLLIDNVITPVPFTSTLIFSLASSSSSPPNATKP